jgi:hypothetical protein
MDQIELVWITLNHFGPSWHHFVQCICAREKLPTLDKLWDDFIGEEMILEMISKNFEKLKT